MRSVLKNKSVFRIRCARCMCLAAGILFIGIGLVRQEHLEVMQKAVRICLECVGIG